MHRKALGLFAIFVLLFGLSNYLLINTASAITYDSRDQSKLPASTKESIEKARAAAKEAREKAKANTTSTK